MNLFVYSLVGVGILNILFGIFVLTRNIKSRFSQYFFGLIMSIALWAIGLGIFINVETEFAAFNAAKVYYSAPIYIAFFVLIFSMVFPEESRIPWWKLLSLILPALLLNLFIVFIPDFLLTELVYNNWGKEIKLGTFGYFLYSIYFLIYFYSGIIVLWIKSRKAKGIVKTQIIYVVVSLFIASIFGTIFDLYLPWFGNYRLIWVGPQFTIIILIAIFYAMARYRLFDIRIIFGRITYIALLATILYVSFYTSLIVDQIFFGSSFEIGALIFGVFFALGYVSVYEYINKFIKEKVTSTFINPGFDPVETINKLNTHINTILDSKEISDYALSTIAKTIRPSYEAILIGNLASNKIEIRDSKTRPEFNYKNIANAITIWETVGEYAINIDEIDIEIPRRFRNMKNWLEIVVEEMNKVGLKIAVPIKSGTEGEFLGIILLGAKEGEVPYNSIETKYLMDIGDALGAALARSFLHNEVKELNDNLQHKVEDATHELREKVLALEEARRKERDMLDILGHELRTPLTIVRNAINMLKMWDQTNNLTEDKLNKYLDMAMDNLVREVKLLETMLTTTKIDNENLSLTLEKVDLHDVIDNSMHALREKGEKKGLKIIYNEPKDVFIFADRTRFQEIIDNIFDNAIKYTHEGFVQLDVYDEKKMVVIKISDSGIGIPKKDIEKLGQKFYRINTYLESSKRAGVEIVRPGGTGLGLYVVFQLIKAMGGDVRVESEIDKGSIFYISVPKFVDQQKQEIGAKRESTFERFKKLKEEREKMLKEGKSVVAAE